MASDNSKVESNSEATLLLIGMSVLSVGIGYATSIEVAQLLGPRGFEEYVVAIATLGMLGAFSEAGVGKYALKALPEYSAATQWSLASGYWRFSLLVSLLVSTVIATAVVAGDWLEDQSVGEHGIGLIVLFLPAVALSSVLIDLIMAIRASVVGMVIARLLIPGATFAMITAVGVMADRPSSKVMIVCFGCGSVVGLAAAGWVFSRRSPQEFFQTTPTFRRDDWIKDCVSFAIIGFLSVWLLRVSIVVVELLPIPSGDVAYSAAALETGGLILLLAKSTDKLFQPQMAMIIRLRDWEAGEKVQRERYSLIGIGCLSFVVVMSLFGDSILSLYGEGFREAYVALLFVSAGASVWTMCSLGPAYLRFVGKGMFVTSVLSVGAVMMAILTAVLARSYRVTGVGIAFCVTMSTIGVVFQVAANRHWKLQQNGEREE